MSNVLHTSRRGVLFVSRWEGLRLSPYNDAAGNATIGYGHLLHVGEVTQRDKDHFAHFGAEQALLLLQADMEHAAHAVASLVNPPFKLQHRFDAVVSLVFNIGVGAFTHSTLLVLLNLHERGRVAGDEFLRWDRAGGKVLPGLTNRREAERALYLTGRYGQ